MCAGAPTRSSPAAWGPQGRGSNASTLAPPSRARARVLVLGALIVLLGILWTPLPAADAPRWSASATPRRTERRAAAAWARRQARRERRAGSSASRADLKARALLGWRPPLCRNRHRRGAHGASRGRGRPGTLPLGTPTAEGSASRHAPGSAWARHRIRGLLQARPTTGAWTTAAWASLYSCSSAGPGWLLASSSSPLRVEVSHARSEFRHAAAATRCFAPLWNAVNGSVGSRVPRRAPVCIIGPPARNTTDARSSAANRAGSRQRSRRISMPSSRTRQRSCRRSRLSRRRRLRRRRHLRRRLGAPGRRNQPSGL